MNYYEMIDDNKMDKWYLSDIEGENDSNIWKYSHPNFIENYSKELVYNIYHDGKRSDVSFSEHNTIVVNEKVKDALSQNTDLQFIPVKVKGDSGLTKYYIMVFINAVECVDESKSNFTTWEKNNHVRPEKSGLYKGFFKLVINPSRTNGHTAFRLKKFNPAVIVDEDIKNKLEEIKATGIYFNKVTE